MVLCFLHQLQHEVGEITDFTPFQQTCVTKPTKLTKIEAASLALEEQSLYELAGKQYVF
ncbi:unnamed protein product [Brassica napus]|uniref:Uncharacterized protein n=2 Tax=Brassica TaxID=3705 RepID=A0A3P6AYC1_BRACM|nr:unnamed protein product [Brassica napus]VDC91944.1 unnamed protein product [Brassica rapa]